MIQGMLFKKNNLMSVELGITRRCNLSCGYCVLGDEDCIKNELAQENNEMTTQQIKTVFSMLNGLDIERINISGGEPLVREDIAEILESAFLNKFKVSLTTNGILAPKFLDLLAGLDLLIISIDGTKETHDCLRGEGTYESAMNAIELCKAKGIKMIFSSVMTSKTLVQDLSFLMKLSDLYDTFCVLQPVCNGGFFPDGYRTYDKLDPLVVPVERLEYFYRYLKGDPNKKRIIGGDDYIRFILEVNKRRQRGIRRLENCMAGKLFFYIASGGSMFLCSQRFQKLLNKRIYDCTLEEIENMPVAQVKCPGCECYSYSTLNKLARFDLFTIINSLRKSYI